MQYLFYKQNYKADTLHEHFCIQLPYSLPLTTTEFSVTVQRSEDILVPMMQALSKDSKKAS